MKRNGLTVPKEVSEKFRVAGMVGRTTFTLKEDRYIKANYLTMPVKRIGENLKRSYTGIMCRLRQMGLEIPAAIRERNKQESQIQAGSIPANKGLKQTEWMSRKAINKSKVSRFKAGQLPHNTKSDMAVTIREDKRGVQYKHIRIAVGKWTPLHRYNWMQVNGPIPPKMKLTFKDGDTMNCSVENILCMTPGELMKHNSYHNYPKPVALMVQLRGALNRKINRKLKQLQK